MLILSAVRHFCRSDPGPPAGPIPVQDPGPQCFHHDSASCFLVPVISIVSMRTEF